MPAKWNLATTQGSWTVQDYDQFNRLPFYMAQQQAVNIPYFSRYKDIFAKRRWEANKGDVLVGVINEQSAVTSQVMKPTYMTSNPLKTVVSNYQRTNTARLYMHDFESPLFGFLPNFRDFVKGPIRFAANDITRQQGIGFDAFMRWQMFQMSPQVYAMGASTPLVTGVPVGPPGEGTLTDPKDANFIASILASIGTDGFASFRNLAAVTDTARESIGMVPWGGVPDAPKDNEVLEGNFLIIGERSIYSGMTWDEHVLNTRMLSQDLQRKKWTGIIQGDKIFRQESYGLRFLADGTMPEPEIYIDNPMPGTITSGTSSITNPGGATRNVQRVPNPTYVSAPFGAFMMFGNDPYEGIDIGPPPEEFTGTTIGNTKRLSKMSWNGEVSLTDNVLVGYGGASGLALDNIDTNKRGRYLQLISTVALGILPNTPRNCLPVFYRRNITPSTTSAV